jgi:hypothetical protein
VFSQKIPTVVFSVEKFRSKVLMKRKLQFGLLQVDSGPEGFVHGASVLDARVCPRKGEMCAGAVSLYIVDIVSSFVCPSVSLLVDKLSPMSSDFNQNGKESETHPLVKNLDDASKYVLI